MLKRKIFRELWLYKSQFITIFLMVFIGVMAYSGIESYMNGMQITGDTFYKENNLQDLNIYGNNFTKEDLQEIKKIKNVKDAERKLNFIATGENDKAFNVSFIESNNISKFCVVDGVKFSYDLHGLWLDEFYAKENKVKVGDVISFTYDNYTFKEKVIGLINVPDHLYDTKDESELYANRKEFGFCFLSVIELEDYIKHKTINELNITEKEFNKLDFKYQDHLVFNNLMVDVDNKENVSKVKDTIDENIDSALGIVNIEDSFSYASYQGEINEGKTYVGVFSGLFIFIAILSVITTMTRIVKKQKLQIGTLKALGFKNRKIIFHYISYSLIVSIIGALLGLVGGYYIIGKIFMNLEMDFFEIPNGKPIMNLSSYICAIVVVLIISFVTYLSTRKNLKEEPANILRNDNINNKKSSSIEKSKVISKLNFKYKWNIRDMLRNKIRTITTIIGISSCTMLIICAFGMLDTMNNFIKVQFEDLYNFKYKLSINDDITDDDLSKLLNKYGNNTSSNLLIDIIDKDNNKISNNIFVDDTNSKVRFLNSNNKFIKLSSNKGVYVTEKFAKVNNYEIGDTIKWQVMGSNNIYKSKIIGFNWDPQNQNMTMTKEYFESLGNTYKPSFIYTNKDLKKVDKINNIKLIQSVDKLKDGMNMMLSAMKTMICLIIFVASILGIVIIYNMGILSFSEKEYQFATLKVLGFKDKKIKSIFINQNNIITFISTIIGIPLGYLLTSWIFIYALEEGFDFKAHINLLTYLIAIVGTYLIVNLVSRILSKKIDKIDMVSSLKGNE